MTKQKMSSQEIRIVDYSKLSIAVYNIPKKYEENFRLLGGLFNPKLDQGSGWLFHSKDKQRIQQLVEHINSGRILPIEQKHSEQEKITKKEFMDLLRRVERLEALISQGDDKIKIELKDDEKKEDNPPISARGMFRKRQ